MMTLAIVCEATRAICVSYIHHHEAVLKCNDHDAMATYELMLTGMFTCYTNAVSVLASACFMNITHYTMYGIILH